MEPDFSWPYFGAAYCYAMYGSWGAKPEFLDIAEDYLKKGFRLDEKSFLGHYSKATLYFWGRWDFIRGHQHYKKSLVLNPYYTEAEEGLIELYNAIGNFDRALAHVQHILSLDPLSKNHHFTIANIYYLTRQPEKAVEYLESGLKIDPNFTHLIELMLLCLIQLKQQTKLKDFLKQNLLAENPGAAVALCQLLNNTDSLQDNCFNGHSEDNSLSEKSVELIPWSLFLHTQLGNHTMAFEILEMAIQNKAGQYMNFKSMPLLKPLQDNKRFKKLVEHTFDPSFF